MNLTDITPVQHTKDSYMPSDDSLTLRPYPETKHNVGSSLLHWWSIRQAHYLQEELRAMPGNQYLELGCFLGAGSTAAALLCRNDLQATCVDSFAITKSKLTHEPSNAWRRRSKKYGDIPTDYWNGIGSALHHFQNNTFEWRDRIRCLQGSITPEALSSIVEEYKLRPGLVLVDFSKEEEIVLAALHSIESLWPEVCIVVDDYTPNKHHAGVVQAVNACGILDRRSYYTAEKLLIIK